MTSGFFMNQFSPSSRVSHLFEFVRQFAEIFPGVCRRCRDINNTSETTGKNASGVVDTGGKFAAGVVDTSGNFAACILTANISANFRKNSKRS